jgi:hydrogenase-4 component F
MGAGVLVRAFDTKQLARMRGGMDRLPWSGPLFLTSILALCAMPPFGLFRSEFEIVAGGLATARHWASAALIVLVTLAFLGLTTATTRVLLQPDRSASVGGAMSTPTEPSSALMLTIALTATTTRTRSEPSVWMVVPVVAGVLVLVVLGVHPPGPLVDLLARGAAELGGGLT